MKSNYDTKINFSHLKVVVIGAGFTGLSAAYELSKLGVTAFSISIWDKIGTVSKAG